VWGRPPIEGVSESLNQLNKVYSRYRFPLVYLALICSG
jgi:hypothetical protein